MLVEVEIWTVGQMECGTAVILRVPSSVRCLPIYVKPNEAKKIHLLAKGNRNFEGFTDFFATFTAAVSVFPDYVEIHQGDKPGVYFSSIHFAKNREVYFSIKAPIPFALMLTSRMNLPILIETAILENFGVNLIIEKREEGHTEHIARLREELGQKVHEEEYEQAAVIRDQIKKIEEQMRLKKES
ncbi:MAG: hypothetical protein B6D68_00520 [spirochete symbiont of Stewartia floridana]|nr:MAG: hypothetical protein B6D68_00520 [spirochete symbiont of Stewartia floridana]